MLKKKLLMMIFCGVWLAFFGAPGRIPPASAQPSNSPMPEDIVNEQIRSTTHALQAQEKALGPAHPLCIELLLKLASMYHGAGAHSQALLAYERAIQVLDSSLGPGNSQSRQLLPRVVEQYSILGEITSGKTLPTVDSAIFKKVLQHQRGNLGSGHPQVKLLQNYTDSESLSDADRKAAVHSYPDISEEELRSPGQNPETALRQLQTGETLWHEGEFSRAYTFSRQAHQSLRSLLGPAHPKTVQALGQLILILIDKQDREEANILAPSLYEAEDDLMRAVLSVMSEKERRQFLSKHNPFALPAALGDHERLAQAALRYKSIVLDSIIEDIRLTGAGQDPYLAALLGERREIKDKLVGYYFSPKVDGDDPGDNLMRAEMTNLRIRLETMERELAHYVSGLGHVRQALQVTPSEIQNILPEDSVLVEYIRYPHYLGKDQWEPRYAAVALGFNGPARWIPLGRASEIDDLIRRCQQAISDDSTDDGQLKDILKTLHTKIWLPAAATFAPSVKSVVLSPDGMLHFVSFAVLLTEEDHFLVEKYQLRYVGSGRDVLNPARPSQNNEIFIFSSPQYQASNFWQDVWGRLPGSLDEGRRISTLAKRYHFSVSLFSGASASEENLRRIRSPRILHLATHGYLFNETRQPAGSRERLPISLMTDDSRHWSVGPHSGIIDPMNQGGLVLASTNTERQLDGFHPGQNSSDGIMTAEEIGLLSLEGTLLAVAPACYTGLGSAEDVEGPLGVRRGFMLAGVANLVTALWEVADEQTTPALMEEFYRHVFETGDPAAAMTLTQRRWLPHLRKTKGLHKAVKQAGELILISRDN